MLKAVQWLVVLLSFAQVPGVRGGEGWVFKSPMPTPRFGFSAVVFEGKIYVMGGRSADGKILDIVERYDPETDSWDGAVPPMRRNRVHCAAVVYDGKIFVLGGRTESSEDEGDDDSNVLDKVEFFNPQEQKWESFQDMEVRREGLSAVVLSDTMYAVGGSDERNIILASVEYYDIEDDEWKLSNPWRLVSPSAALQTVVVNDSAFSIGGFSPVPVPLIQRYHPATGTDIRASLMTPRGGLAATVWQDNIYVLGGLGVRSVLSSVERFDPAGDVLDATQPMNVPRENFVAVTLGDHIYAIGGRSGEGEVLASVEALDVVTSVVVEDPPLPDDFGLEQNYPNPFNAGTRIRFQVSGNSRTQMVHLRVFNTAGHPITTLVHQPMAPGTYEVVWDGTDGFGFPVASGTYIVSLQQGALKTAKKMTLIR